MANFVSSNQIQIQIGLVLFVRPDTCDDTSQPSETVLSSHFKTLTFGRNRRNPLYTYSPGQCRRCRQVTWKQSALNASNNRLSLKPAIYYVHKILVFFTPSPLCVCKIYRMVHLHLVAEHSLLTSNQKFRHSRNILY